MLETINNHEGQAEAEPSEFEKAMADAPAFDREAAMAAYEAEHPEAVRDVEKARAMAEAGDTDETWAARDMEEARHNMMEYGHAYGYREPDQYVNDSHTHPVESALHSLQRAEIAEEAAGKKYDEEKAEEQRRQELAAQLTLNNLRRKMKE